VIDIRALAEIVLATICCFFAAFQIGGYIRGAVQLGDSTSIKMLTFFAVVALAGGLMGAHAAGVGVARARQNLVK